MHAVVTTIVSIVHGVYIIRTGGPKVLISALVEDCMSLTVANVPVVATALIGALRGHGSSTPHTVTDDEGQQFSSFRFRSRFTNVIRGGITGMTTTRGIGTTQAVSVNQVVETSKHMQTSGSNTDTDFELATKSSYPSNDRGNAHYISIGSLQGEEAHGTTRTADEHYISIGPVRGKEDKIQTQSQYLTPGMGTQGKVLPAVEFPDLVNEPHRQLGDSPHLR
jgi:hypothetical protein